MGLFDIFRPKWKHSNPDVRIEAAKELSDHKTLLEMAAKDREWFVRHEVFALLRERDVDQEGYAYLARNSTDEEIRCKAVKRLTEEAALEEVARADQYRYVRDAAEHRLEELRQNRWGERPEAESAQKTG